jgi:hypothetical protein
MLLLYLISKEDKFIIEEVVNIEEPAKRETG